MVPRVAIEQQGPLDGATRLATIKLTSKVVVKRLSLSLYIYIIWIDVDRYNIVNMDRYRYI